MNANRRKPRPPTLFDNVPQRRYVTPENDNVYMSVTSLRRLGYRVYRGGRQTHLVDGRRVTTRELMAMAGWPLQGRALVSALMRHINEREAET